MDYGVYWVIRSMFLNYDAYLLGITGGTVFTTRRKKGARWLSKKNAEALSNHFPDSVIEEITPDKRRNL